MSWNVKFFAIMLTLAIASEGILAIFSFNQIIREELEPLLGQRLMAQAQRLAHDVMSDPNLTAKLPRVSLLAPEALQKNDLYLQLKKKLYALSQDPDLLDLHIHWVMADAELPNHYLNFIATETQTATLPKEPAIRDSFMELLFHEKKPLFSSFKEIGFETWISGGAPLISQQGTFLGVIRVQYDGSNDIKKALISLLGNVAKSMLVSLGLMALFGFFFSIAFTRPLKKLTRMLKPLATSDLSPKPAENELSALIQNFSNILETLHTQQSELRVFSAQMDAAQKEKNETLAQHQLTLHTIMDMLEDSVFLFAQDDRCISIGTKPYQNFFKADPKIAPLHEVLGADPKTLQIWLTRLFNPHIPFEQVKGEGPQKILQNGRTLTLHYEKVQHSKQDSMTWVLCLAKETHTQVGLQTWDTPTQSPPPFESTPMHPYFESFLETMEQSLRSLQSSPLTYLDALRTLHTVRGCASFFDLKSLEEKASYWENQLSPHVGTMAAPITRALHSELSQALHQSLASYPTLNQSTDVDPLALEAHLSHALQMKNQVQALDYLLDFLLMKPVETFFSQTDFYLKTLAHKMHKKMNPLQILGGKERVYLKPYTPLFHALVHAFRNSLDHGIEPPGERIALGKPAAGTLTLKFTKDAHTPWIECSDDGRGLIEHDISEGLKNFDPSHETSDLKQALFMPGFSLSKTPSFSGQGLGLDIIHCEVQKLEGKVWFTSIPHHQTTLHIQVPFFTYSRTNLTPRSHQAA